MVVTISHSHIRRSTINRSCNRTCNSTSREVQYRSKKKKKKNSGHYAPEPAGVPEPCPAVTGRHFQDISETRRLELAKLKARTLKVGLPSREWVPNRTWFLCSQSLVDCSTSLFCLPYLYTSLVHSSVHTTRPLHPPSRTHTRHY